MTIGGATANAAFAARFWANVQTGPVDECWPWTAYIDTTGYGKVGVPGVGSRGAHRVAYELAYGAVPDGLCVMHSCDHRPCCNPEHLSAGTRAENNADAARKGRTSRGAHHSTAKLTEDDVATIRRLHQEGVAALELARRFNVSDGTIWPILKRTTWRHV